MRFDDLVDLQLDDHTAPYVYVPSVVFFGFVGDFHNSLYSVNSSSRGTSVQCREVAACSTPCFRLALHAPAPLGPLRGLVGPSRLGQSAAPLQSVCACAC